MAKKAKAMKGRLVALRKFLEENYGAPDMKGVELAAKFKVSESTASYARRDWRLAHEGEIEAVPFSSNMSLAVSLREEETLEIKVQNEDHRIRGTVILGLDGIRFQRANQKKPADRLLTYGNLDKIMQLGLL